MGAPKHSVEEVHAGLAALALNNGSTRAAARLLEGQDLALPESTLRRWKTEHRQRYHEIRTVELPKLRYRMERRLRELTDAAVAEQAKQAAANLSAGVTPHEGTPPLGEVPHGWVDSAPLTDIGPTSDRAKQLAGYLDMEQLDV